MLRTGSFSAQFEQPRELQRRELGVRLLTVNEVK